MRIQSRDQHQRLVHQFVDSLGVRLDSNHTVIGEGNRSVAQQSGRVQDILNLKHKNDIQILETTNNLTFPSGLED